MPPEPAAISLTINGERFSSTAEPRKLLVDFLRENAGLTGTHAGCEHGICGACTVLMDGMAVRSCLTLAVQAAGKDVWTVEGLAAGETLSPLQESFRRHHGLQCGFCTPGMLMAAIELLRDNPEPTETDIREGISGNLCRCTGYQNIIASIAATAEKLRAGEVEPVLRKAFGDAG